MVCSRSNKARKKVGNPRSAEHELTLLCKDKLHIGWGKNPALSTIALRRNEKGGLIGKKGKLDLGGGGRPIARYIQIEEYDAVFSRSNKRKEEGL